MLAGVKFKGAVAKCEGTYTNYVYKQGGGLVCQMSVLLHKLML